MSVETPTYTIEHILLPAYRYKEQLLDLYASPETLVSGNQKEYILTEILSQICTKLGTTAVLINLCSGISEISAPFLFDPRVSKYLVTSTSPQSVRGTKLLLEFLLKGLDCKNQKHSIPDVILPPDSSKDIT